MKIENFKIENENLNRIFKTGRNIIVATGLSLALVGCSFSSKEESDVSTNTEVESMVVDLEEKEATAVSLEDINQLGIILCDSNCNKEIFEATVEKFKENGVEVLTATPNDEDLLSRSSSTVITLSSTVYHSDHAVILGQYDNNKCSNSDALALAMEAGLKSQKVAVDGIRLGITQVENDPSITHRVPTGTELKIAPSSSFVTIALGSEMNPEEKDIISEGIMEGVIRAASDIKEHENADYLYRITGVDTIDGMAHQMNVDANFLIQVNSNLEKDLIQIDDVVVHPDATNNPAFQQSQRFQLSSTQKASSL